MSAGFQRTLKTASEADGVATLLARAANRAKQAWALGDAARLLSLAERYRDYAAALRETAGEAPVEPDPEQEALL